MRPSRPRSPLPLAAMVVAITAVVLSLAGTSVAVKGIGSRVSARPQPNSLLLLNAQRKFPSAAIPKVRRAVRADRVGDLAPEDLRIGCGPQAVDLGTWCLLATPYSVPNEDTGKSSFFYASQACAEMGGYLPTAAQLIGAADRVKLASTIDDSPLTASTDVDPTDGLKDRREMSATLTTTAAGSTAAGSQGVSDGSRGDPKTGEPDPVPQPANPSPQTLQYVTVYDNRNKGGFAGSKPVGQAELFRCAFDKAQGPQSTEGEGGESPPGEPAR